MSLLLRRYHAKAEPSGVEAPGGSASKKAWTEYALTEGKSAEELEGLTRDQIRDLFTDPAEGSGAQGQPDGNDQTPTGTGEAPDKGADGADPDKNE
jgi:hypothetical protein